MLRDLLLTPRKESARLDYDFQAGNNPDMIPLTIHETSAEVKLESDPTPDVSESGHNENTAEIRAKQYKQLIAAGAYPDKTETMLLNMLPESEHESFKKLISAQPESESAWIVSESGHNKRNWKVVNARRSPPILLR